MEKEISISFSNLKNNGIVKKVDNQFKNENVVHIKESFNDVKKVSLDFEPTEYFLKNTSLANAVISIASANMYQSIGINTPPVFMLKKHSKYSAQTIQQSVHSFNQVILTLANSDLEFAKIEQKFFGKFKWQIFYNDRLIQEFLKFMTPECLEQLQNIFLVDEMRTDIDRHKKNYFFYKRPESDKYEGVIAIDLELMVIFNYCGTNKDDFSDFILYPYQSVTPQGATDEICYLQRIKDIRELIYDGVLSSGNIQALTRALKYDYSGEVNKVCKDSHIYLNEKNKIVTPVKRLWEYNQQTIGKDLGL